MDSDAYLLKIIRSGSKGTEDSLYLQTTIGKGIRWPIALLISTVISVLVLVLCMVWRQIRRPVGANSQEKNRNYQHVEDPKVTISSSRVFETNKIRKSSRDHMLTSSVFLENSPNYDRLSPRRSKSEQNLSTWFKDDHLPKRKVSWAPSKSIKHIPGIDKLRRHSEMTPISNRVGFPDSEARRHSEVATSSNRADFPDTHCSFSVSSVSTVVGSCSQDVVPLETDAAIIKVNKPSQLHLQISKTIAVLDDLNKSLQENHSNSDSPPMAEPVTSTPVLIHHDKKNKRKQHQYKFFKPLVKNTEIKGNCRRNSSQDGNIIDELENLLDEHK